MAYKVQTNKVTAFLVQDLTAFLAMSVITGFSGFMSYTHFVQAGEQCASEGRRVFDTCSPVWAYALFIPVTVLGVFTLTKFIYNLFKIGTISPVYLKYRNFSGSQASVAQTVSSATPSNEEKEMTEFPYRKFMKLNIFYMLGAAMLLAMLPFPSWVNVLAIYAIPLFANVFSVRFMSVNRIWAVFTHVFRSNKQLNVPFGTNDPRVLKFYELRADIARSRIKMIGILFLMAVIAMVLSAISVGVKKAIYS